mmetsp:Transcript_14568/g.46297  ORF Transcript_14568/g.46297 Transcript_14568/m.46297 type:complete len:101 (+) Transcript_14568:238-540(+)
MRSPKMISHPFVHKTHRDVFGSLFPLALSNVEHDEWMSRVYGYKSTFLHSAAQVYNTHRYTGRARSCPQSKQLVDREIAASAEILKQWVFRQVGVAGWTF